MIKNDKSPTGTNREGLQERWSNLLKQFNPLIGKNQLNKTFPRLGFVARFLLRRYLAKVLPDNSVEWSRDKNQIVDSVTVLMEAGK